MPKNNQTLNILFGLLWFVLVPIIFVVNIGLTLIGINIVDNTSVSLGYIIYFWIPIVIIFLPLIIKLLIKKTFLKSLGIAFGVIIAYFISLAFLITGLTMYFHSFSKAKWENYEWNRYLMIEDLEQKYNFIGMTKAEVINLLGNYQVNYTVAYNGNAIGYNIKSGFFYLRSYILILDDNDIVLETKIVAQD